MISSFPEHVLYQTGLQRQINVGYIGLQQGTKSASRPADKPFINPLSAARRPRVLFLHRFIYNFLCSCFQRDIDNSLLVKCGSVPHRFTWDCTYSYFWRVVQDICIRCLEGYEKWLSSGRTVLLASRPNRLRPAAPPCAHPPVICSVFGFDLYFDLMCVYLKLTV